MTKNIYLKEIEEKISRNCWNQNDFQVDVNQNPNPILDKYFITVPYPYMNGQLHLGHLFTFIRASFMADFQRMLGKKVLFPFSFHSSGMPILGSCRLLERELQEYGNPPKFPKENENNEKERVIDVNHGNKETKTKAKMETKFGNQKYQWDIFKSMGIPETEIDKFTNPEHTIKYFMEKATQDLKMMSFPVDWRRTFTTIPELNNYYPIFVEWVFGKLESKGYLKKGKRFMIWSPDADCPCLAHDRSQGEKAVVVESSIIRHDINLETLENEQEKWKQLKYFNLPISLLVATQNPKDYSKSNICLNPNTDYKVARIKIDSVEFLAISNQESLENLSYQEYPSTIIDNVKGSVLIGIKTLSGKNIVTSVNLDSSKGTGIVMSGIVGDDSVVSDDNVISDALKESGYLFPYAESSQIVTSRSGDKCVVALSDQWFIDYGNTEWKEKVLDQLDNVNFYNQVTRDFIPQTIEELHEWPVSRNFGLGTKYQSKKQPDLEPFLIDSLSDSTVYMAFYTISHYLEEIGKTNSDIIKPDFFEAIFCDGDFEDIFNGDNEENNQEKKELKRLFQKAQAEFKYWFPFDLRISGKDLLGNHLPYCLMTHMAIWDTLPKGMASNGHILIDGEKMSKGKGTFIMVEDSIKEYSVSAIRMVLASIPTSPLKDSNYQIKEQNDWVRRLHTYILDKRNLIDKLKRIKESSSENKNREKNFYDNYFENQLLKVAENVSQYYQNLDFYEVVNEAFYNLDSLFNTYCILVANDPYPDTLEMYLEYSLKMMTPLIPHLTQDCWNYWWGEGERDGELEDESKNNSNIRFQPYPNQPRCVNRENGEKNEKRKIDWKLIEAGDYLIHIVEYVNKKRGELLKMKSKHGETDFTISNIKIILGDLYTPWQKRILDLIKKDFQNNQDNQNNQNNQDNSKGLIARMIPIIAQDQFIIDSKIKINKMANSFLGMINKKINQDNGSLECLNYQKALNKYQLLVDNTHGLSAKLGLKVEIEFNPDKNPDKPILEFS